MRNKSGVKTKIGTAFFAALVGLVIGMAPRAQGKALDEIAVVVDQDAMTRGELNESIQGLFLAQRVKPAAPGTADYEKAKSAIIDGFIREVLLSEEADRQKIEISDGEVEQAVNNEVEGMKKGFPTEQDFDDELKREGITMDDLKQDAHDKILRRMKAQRALHMKQQDLPSSATATDDQVQQYFKQHPQDFEQVKFSIILFRLSPKSKPEYVKEVEKQAKGVLKELQGGADFATYAKKYSEDPGSAEKGGAVGTVYRSDLEPKLAKGVFAIPEKGLGLVRGADGFYIVKVDFKGDADYASVAPAIKEHLKGEKQDSGLRDWLNSLKKNAYILVDGKPVSGNFMEAASTDESQGTAKSPATATAETAPEEAQGNSSTAAATTQAAGSTPGEVYPSLPPGDSFSFYFAGNGFFYGTQDLANYYPSGTNVGQSFPFGYGLNLGVDWSLDPSIQVGLMGEVFRKWAENVGYDQWTGLATGAALGAKLLLPLDESTNFVVSAAGGLYFLVGSTADFAGTTVNLNGSTWGGRGGVDLEFLLDEQKNSAIDIGGGYRILNFNVTGAPQPATVDFSGPFAELGLKFYFGKD